MREGKDREVQRIRAEHPRTSPCNRVAIPRFSAFLATPSLVRVFVPKIRSVLQKYRIKVRSTKFFVSASLASSSFDIASSFFAGW